MHAKPIAHHVWRAFRVPGDVNGCQTNRRGELGFPQGSIPLWIVALHATLLTPKARRFGRMASSPLNLSQSSRPDPDDSRRLRETNAILLAFAEVQHGVVSRRQLIAHGLSEDTIGLLVRQLRLVPVFRGVYGVGRGVINDRGRWRAGLLAAGPESALARRSAAALWGFGNRVRVTEVVRLFNRRSGNRPREMNVDDRPNRLVIHRTRCLPETDLTTVDGFAVTTVARALLDLASVSNDKQVAAYLGAASRLGLLDLEEIDEACSRGPGWRGSRRLRREVERLPPGEEWTKSDLEDLFLRICQDHAIPEPEVNVMVEGIEVDCFWPSARFAVELDSYTFHRGRAAFEKDRTRDLDLAGKNYRVLRFTHRMLEQRREQVAASVLEVLDKTDRRRPRGA